LKIWIEDGIGQQDRADSKIIDRTGEG